MIVRSRTGIPRAMLLIVCLLVFPALATAEEGFTPSAAIPVIKGMELLTLGTKAPLFNVKDLNGAEFDLSKELGKNSFLLVFWSIYCEPCREEMPLIEKTYNQFKSKGLEVLAVNMDGDPFLDATRGFIKQSKYTFRVLMDELQQEGNFKIADPYNVAGTPVIYLIDKKGVISATKLGRVGEAELTQLVEKLLATP
jgi:peroxiredoxin